jgi:hypothetical protein
LELNHKLKKPVLLEGKDAGSAEEKGKAYLQVLFDDYLKRGSEYKVH